MPTWEKISGRSGWPAFNIRSIMALAEYDGSVFVGIRTDRQDGMSLPFVLRYDRGLWSVAGSQWGPHADRVDTLCPHAGCLYAGISGEPSSGKGAEIWKLDERGWQLKQTFPCSSVWKILSTVDGLIVAVGTPKDRLPSIYRLTSELEKIGEFPGYTHILDLATYDGYIFAGFIGKAHVWRFDGHWTRERIPAIGSITALHPLNGHLYAGLWRSRIPAPLVWKRTSFGWMPCAWKPNAKIVESIEIHNSKLYIGGGIPSPFVNGHTWPSKKDRYVYNMLSTPQGLFATTGGAEANGGEVWINN